MIRFFASYGKQILWLAVAVALAGAAVAVHLRGYITARSRDTYHSPGCDQDGQTVLSSEHGGERLTSAHLAGLIEDESAWLLSCRLPNGAIAQSPGSNTVIPYFANLAAKTLLRINPEAVRDYITWYLSSLNKPDKWGLCGTIYDFRVEYIVTDPQAGEPSTLVMMVPTASYDSADSYASTFLSLVSDYYFTTGDKELIRSNLQHINMVANVVVQLQDEDGLVFVKPGSWTKYLMDNAENYRGLSDWSQVLLEEGLADDAEHFKNAAENIRQGIFNVLYDRRKGTYAWSISPLRKRFPREGKWYPDGVSQLYLLTCGLVSPEDPEAQAIWLNFVKNFPARQTGGKKDVFPWAGVAVASLKMGDRMRAMEFVNWAGEQYLVKDRPYPWYVLESANLITVLYELIQ